MRARPRHMKRWLVPLAAAAAVLVLLGGLWWLVGPGSPSADTSFAGGDTNSGSPGDGGDGSPGSEPGVDPSPGTVQPAPKQTNPMGVVIDSYHAYDADSLAINYTIGVPACYGKIGVPDVEETSRSVTVTLTRIPPKQSEDTVCIEIALLKTVDIELSSPLGDRQVRDGSFDAAVVRPGQVPSDDDAVY